MVGESLLAQTFTIRRIRLFDRPSRPSSSRAARHKRCTSSGWTQFQQQDYTRALENFSAVVRPFPINQQPQMRCFGKAKPCSSWANTRNHSRPMTILYASIPIHRAESKDNTDGICSAEIGDNTRAAKSFAAVADPDRGLGDRRPSAPGRCALQQQIL